MPPRAIAVHRPRRLRALPRPPAQKFDAPAASTSAPTTRSRGLDCYLDAVVHLYTMCRHVKSIEIIEFGHAKAQEGVNGAKSEYCVDKQKINITRPYQAALREATPWQRRGRSPARAAGLLARCHGQARVAAGEAADDYEDRVNKVYDESVVEDRRGARRVHARQWTTRRRQGGARAAKPKAAKRQGDGRRKAELEPQSWTSPRRPTPDTEHADAGRRRRARRDLPRGRHAVERAARVPLPPAAARDGAGHRAGHRRAQPARGRSRHGHRQDVRLPRARAALRRQGHHLHGHQDAAGPALRARPAARARRARGAGHRGAAQGPRQLRVPLPPRARRARGPAAVARRRAPPAQDRRLRARLRARRPRRALRRAGERDHLAARHVHARQLPRPELPASRRLLRDEGAQGSARRRRRRRQSPPLLRRRDAARRRRGGAPAQLQHGDPRRGAPAPRYGNAVLRRAGRGGTAGRARARCRDRGAHGGARRDRACPMRRASSRPP